MTVGLSVANGEMIQTESGIVIDTDTKLMWQDNFEAKTVKKTWQDAIDYCKNLTLAEFDDWKLSEKDTIKAFYSKKSSLKNIASGYYWSNSPYIIDASRAWYIDFYDGSDGWFYKSSSNFVRCVRESNFETLTFSSFMESLKTSHTTKKSIVISTLLPSTLKKEEKLFLVKKDGKNYFGTKDELVRQFGMQKESQVGFSKILLIVSKNSPNKN
jgi:hypothetical protein